jgi:hypothetical protein
MPRTTTPDLWAKRDPHVVDLYESLLAATRRFGAVEAEVKTTSIHLVAAKGSAFAGVHPRKSGFLLTIRSSDPIKSRRVRKVDRVSAHRFHNDLLITAPDDIDAEVLGWLRTAYDLAVKRA